MKTPASFVLLLPIALAAPAQDAAKPARPEAFLEKPLSFTPPDRRASRRMLASGAVAYLVRDAACADVEVVAFFRAGSYLDPLGKEGLAEVTAQALRSGGTAAHGAVPARPPAAFDAELGRLGAELEISIGETHGRARLRVGAAQIAPAVALMTDALRNPAFDESALKRAKATILRELAGREDTLDAIERRTARRLLRGDHFSTRLPSRESLAAITAADVASLPAQLLFPRNLLLAVSGGFDEASITTTLDEALADWPNVDSPLPVPPEAGAPAAPGVYLIDAGRAMATARVRVALPGLRRDHADRAVTEAVTESLGGVLLPSRIDRVLRLEKGLSWSPRAETDWGDAFRGSISLAGPTLAANASATARAFLDEIRRAGEERLPADALLAVRQALVDRAASIDRSAAERASRFALDELVRADAEELARDRARFEALTADDCLRVARRVLDPAKAIVIVVGDAATLERCVPAWSTLGPVQRAAP